MTNAYSSGVSNLVVELISSGTGSFTDVLSSVPASEVSITPSGPSRWLLTAPNIPGSFDYTLTLDFILGAPGSLDVRASGTATVNNAPAVITGLPYLTSTLTLVSGEGPTTQTLAEAGSSTPVSWAHNRGVCPTRSCLSCLDVYCQCMPGSGTCSSGSDCCSQDCASAVCAAVSRALTPL